MTEPVVSRETRERLVFYGNEVKRWNRAINLVAPSTVDDLHHRHIADSLQLLPHLSVAGALVDLGSGAGFPGLAIGIACPTHRVHLVESSGKKAGFLRRMVGALDLANVTVHATRIEAFGPQFGSADIITARALANLDRLLTWSEPMIAPHTICLFPKGARHAAEIDEARSQWSFDVDVIRSTTHSDSALLRLTGIVRR